MSAFNICFKSLQGKDTTIIKQNDRLSMYCAELQLIIFVSNVGSNGLDVVLEAAQLESQIRRRGNRVEYRGGVLGFIQKLGSIVCSLFEKLTDIEQHELLEATSDLVLALFEKIDSLIAMQNGHNAPKPQKIFTCFARELGCNGITFVL